MAKVEVAVVMSEVFLRRLTPSFAPYVERHLDFRIISIHRPRRELLGILRSLPVQGLLVEWLPEVTEELLTLGLPTVIVDTDYVYPDTASIDVDDEAIGREAALALLNAGFSQLACVTNGTPYAAQRLAGFQNALPDPVKLHTHEVTAFTHARYSEAFAVPDAALKNWLNDLPLHTGLFAVHDPLGRFICNTAATLGRRIPETLAVIGANNDELVCNLSYPLLSSVAIPWGRVSMAAVQAMLALLDGEPAPTTPQLIAPGSVVLRHSANFLAVPDDLLRRAMNYLTEHLGDPINVTTMCAALHCARRTLERSFRTYYQTTPWEMLCRLRVQRAKLILTQTHHPIGRVAEMVGFNDAERFAVVFKRLEGLPPSQFRKQNV